MSNEPSRAANNLEKATFPGCIGPVRMLAYYPSTDLGAYQAYQGEVREDIFFTVNRQGLVRFFRGFGALQAWLRKNRYEAIEHLPAIFPTTARIIEDVEGVDEPPAGDAGAPPTLRVL